MSAAIEYSNFIFSSKDYAGLTIQEGARKCRQKMTEEETTTKEDLNR
jgi:hypothetical protein